MKTHKTRHRDTLYCNTLSDILKVVNKIIADNPSVKLTYDDFEIADHVEYGETEICLYYYLPETNIEKLSREQGERFQKERQEEWDRKQYETLKKKYGTNE